MWRWRQGEMGLLCLKLPANHQKLGERHGTDSPSQPSEGTNPANTCPPGPWDNKFPLFKPPSLGYFVTAALENSCIHSSCLYILIALFLLKLLKVFPSLLLDRNAFLKNCNKSLIFKQTGMASFLLVLDPLWHVTLLTGCPSLCWTGGQGAGLFGGVLRDGALVLRSQNKCHSYVWRWLWSLKKEKASFFSESGRTGLNRIIQVFSTLVLLIFWTG